MISILRAVCLHSIGKEFPLKPKLSYLPKTPMWFSSSKRQRSFTQKWCGSFVAICWRKRSYLIFLSLCLFIAEISTFCLGLGHALPTGKFARKWKFGICVVTKFGYSLHVFFFPFSKTVASSGKFIHKLMKVIRITDDGKYMYCENVTVLITLIGLNFVTCSQWCSVQLPDI